MRSLAFLVLLRDGRQARTLSSLLEGLVRSQASTASTFLVPDVRGLDFFASPERQAAVDRWWSSHVPRHAEPVYLLAHEPGLCRWRQGLDGHFLIAAAAADAAGYAPAEVVEADGDGAVLALAVAAVTRFGRAPDAPAAVRATAGVPATTAAPVRAGAGPLPPLFEVAPDPLELLAAESAERERVTPIWPDSDEPSPLRGEGPTVGRGLVDALSRRVRVRRAARPERSSDAELAALLLRRPGRVVVVGSRKGGVGKTSHAAGMAIAAGAVLDSVGHSAALVDANIANPDAWGHLRLPPRSATVRDVVTSLAAGAPPPPPVHASTPALACYPERRDGVEYGRTDIRRLAAHLRARHALVVVDMSNRLPDPTGGPEAAVASHWLDEADALVLPTAMSRQDFNGVLDYLDVADLPPTVVPCIMSAARRNRRHPMTREYLEVIRSRVDRLVEIPDEADRVRLAGMQGVPVQEVSPKMRAAYREMLEAVARLRPRPRA